MGKCNAQEKCSISRNWKHTSEKCHGAKGSPGNYLRLVSSRKCVPHNFPWTVLYFWCYALSSISTTTLFLTWQWIAVCVNFYMVINRYCSLMACKILIILKFTLEVKSSNQIFLRGTLMFVYTRIIQLFQKRNVINIQRILSSKVMNLHICM